MHYIAPVQSCKGTVNCIGARGCTDAS